MKKILAFSDCHYNKKVVDLLMENIEQYDYVFFCGDGIDNLWMYSYAYPNKIESVRGNCDNSFSNQPFMIVDKVENVNVLITHGHIQGVKGGLDGLEAEAKRNNADLVVYGHTHKQSMQQRDGVIYLNPGCSGDYNHPEFAEICISEKNIEICLRKLY